MVKRVYQPKKGKRVKKHGFRARMAVKKGHILKDRRAKGRKKLAL